MTCPRAAVVLIACATVLAGCVGAPAASPTEDRPETAEPAPPSIDSPGVPTPEAPPSKGDAAHVHDYWYGASVLVLMEARVPILVYHNHLFDEPPREQHTHGCDETLASTSQGGSSKFSLPEGQIVLPGTRELEILVEWDAKSITGLRLLYRPANEHDPIDAGLLRNGAAFLLPLSAEMADAGHTVRSQWSFFLCADSPSAVDLAQGDALVRIRAFRADTLPLEPAHPDFWRGRTTLVVASRAWQGESLSALNKGDRAWLQIPLDHGAIVPEGTAAVTVQVILQPRGTLESLRVTEVVLYHRDGSVPDWVYKVEAARASSSGVFEFVIAVGPDQVDGVYASESNWDFWLRIGSSERFATPAGSWGLPHRFEGSLEARVTAHAESDA